MLFQIDYHKRQVGKPSSLFSRQPPVKISEKLGIRNRVRRPVSRDRWILVMEMEVVYFAYSIFTANILIQFFALQIEILA